jgi:hypothetical protein
MAMGIPALSAHGGDEMGEESVWRDGFLPPPWLDEDADHTHVQYGHDGLTCDDPREEADVARLWLGYADGGTCVAAYQRDHSGRWVLAGSDLGMLADDVASGASFGSGEDAMAFARQWLQETGMSDRRDFWSRRSW